MGEGQRPLQEGAVSQHRWPHFIVEFKVIRPKIKMSVFENKPTVHSG